MHEWLLVLEISREWMKEGGRLARKFRSRATIQ
jgi:hypothetical protein